ncbi:hypothetical protein [uncultured Cocleimonas sp.]|uniref:hypothetical protein n=1 Tax=uncultured Cocleimonas sp. TaxID=1051587 RepID=UPI00263123F5|nr:hypothetical protein [uncultured Cocleimonas sp.]
MKFMTLTLMSVLVTLSGCSTSEIQLKKNEDAINFSKRVIKGNSSALGKLVASAMTKTTQKSSYTYFTGETIPLNNDINGIRTQFATHCSSVGGKFEGGACKKIGSNDTVLYFVNLKHTGKIYNTTTYGAVKHVGISTISPKKGLNDPAYRKAIRDLGYISPTHEKLINRLDQQLANKKSEMRQRVLNEKLDRHNRELPYKKKIGAKICTVRDNINYIGYVERIAEEKVQIRISHAHVVNYPSMSPGGFKPSIIWANVSIWNLCE